MSAAERPTVAFVGNPNAGKTSLFNALTGSRQKVGNYPGVTVEKVEGTLKLGSVEVECVDIPGLYSLNAQSEDERVAVDAILGFTAARPDLLVCVIDAGNLERNLFLFSQLAEQNLPTVLALTKVDRVHKHGAKIDIAKLSELVGVDVVVVDGLREKGIEELKQTIARNLKAPKVPSVDPISAKILAKEAATLHERLARSGIDRSLKEVETEIVSPSKEFEAFLAETPELREAFAAARAAIAMQWAPAQLAQNRYDWASRIRAAVYRVGQMDRKSRTDRIDYLLTHRVFGLLFFIFIMNVVFQSIYTFAKPLMELIQGGVDLLGGWVSPHLQGIPWIQSMVVDGLIGGVGSVLVFLPQILILFFFISVLEGTGYLARAAFLMDRLLGWCGLNGRAFIPLLSSFACAIPGILAARVMPDPKSRLATILVAPLMSCSARLPVYVLLISAFIQPHYGATWAGIALFAMHLVGLAVAIPIIWILNRRMLKGKKLPFLLELPPYQWPKWRDVWLAMYFKGKTFLQTAGTTIVAMSVLIWATTYFPRAGNGVSESEQLANSYLGRFGRTLEPVFKPAGFDWRLTTGILSAFPARETVVPSLQIIFAEKKNDAEKSKDIGQLLGEATWPDGRKLMTPWTAIGLMVFFALCCQCTSTLATIKKETNSVKWPLFVFSYMTILAYLAAVALQFIGRAFGG